MRRGLVVGLCLLVMVAAPVFSKPVWDTVPKETLDRLGLKQDTSPKDLYQALAKRYRARLNKGPYAQMWEPTPIDAYLVPGLFYKPSANVPNVEVTRQQCVQCHASITPGWVHGWQKSLHANLDLIRKLPDTDPRAYKKAILREVEENLVSLGILKRGQNLREVACIDCHMGVGRDKGNHLADLKMPDRATCGTCHVRQFAEAESEFDTQNWPQGQWPRGHPSHAVDYTANVGLATWVALQRHPEQSSVAVGCTFCHINQAKCDTCHTRHEFSTVDARKPQACATCHNGVDHNEYENYMLSKHGTVYQTLGHTWNWDARLADALTTGGQTAPTCALCHFEYKGQFTHNLARKVRWGFLPFKSIADNLGHPWFEERKEAWTGTCSKCHSPSFARAYFDMTDKGIKAGVEVVEEVRKTVEELYKEGLLVGQKANRPAPPAPEKDEPGGFFGLFFSQGNNPTVVDRIFAEMWEQYIAQHMKALEHVNPGGWTYSAGWTDLIKAKTIINDEATKLRQMQEIEQRLKELEKRGYVNRKSLLSSVETLDPLAALGLGLFLLGAGLLGCGRGGRRR